MPRLKHDGAKRLHAVEAGWRERRLYVEGGSNNGGNVGETTDIRIW